MSNKQRHEVELKFKVGVNRGVIPRVRQELQKAGFIAGARSIETDYLPDTPDDACKKARILLRFRQVDNGNSHELLLTLKVKQDNEGVQHYLEYETNLPQPDKSVVAKINELLKANTGLTLDESVLQSVTLDKVVDAVLSVGFSKHRILLSKYRENFNLVDDNATIDYFPDGMGVYVEFESHSATALHRIIKSAGYDSNDGTDIDYGDLLKLHKANLPTDQQRKALFSAAETRVLNDLVRGNDN